MLMYAALTTLASLAPLALNEAGWLYSAVVTLLDFLLIRKVVKLYRQVEVEQEVNRKDALSLYKYSMLYLALLFLTLVADRSLTFPIPIQPPTPTQFETLSVPSEGVLSPRLWAPAGADALRRLRPAKACLRALRR